MLVTPRLHQLCFVAAIVLLPACSGGSDAAQESLPVPQEQETPADGIEVSAFPSGDGWGYDIYVNGKRYIHQPHIPAVEGVHTFRSEADALKAARFVADKIRKRIIPPQVSRAELDSLGVLPP